MVGVKRGELSLLGTNGAPNGSETPRFSEKEGGATAEFDGFLVAERGLEGLAEPRLHGSNVRCVDQMRTTVRQRGA